MSAVHASEIRDGEIGCGSEALLEPGSGVGRRSSECPRDRRLGCCQEPDGQRTDNEKLSTPAAFIERQVNQVGDDTALAHRVGTFPLCDLEFGYSTVCLQIEWSRRVISRSQRGPLDDYLSVFQEGG
ncbi:hypothetical protein ACWF99_04800 [Nocardia sp. NPDC055002]